MLTEHPIHLLLNPGSVSICGASNNPMKMGTMQAISIFKDGFKGNFYPVHPTEKEVLGYKAYASPLDLPEAPDLAIFIVPTNVVIPLFKQYAERGTKRAVIITAGFKEMSGDGVARERELLEIAKKHGVRIIGPNCMGILNTHLPFNMTVLPFKGKPGSLGLASQSGTYVTQSLSYLRHRGIAFSKAISVGNEADLNIIDVMEYLGGDEQTRAIALYIEG
jgi:acyl-CoA synthetase (NDP forming)